MAIEWTPENAAEERLNAITHGLGCLAAIPAAIWIVASAMDSRPDLVLACAAYGAGLIGVFLFSAASHAFSDPRIRATMRSLDQGFIYCMIAGGYTPFIWGGLTGNLRIAVAAGVWLAAGFGFYSKVFARHRVDAMASTTYILLGWVPTLFLYDKVSLECLLWMGAGGLVYTIGVIFLHFDYVSWYFHSIWHLAVIAASAIHFAAIMHFIVYQQPTWFIPASSSSVAALFGL